MKPPADRSESSSWPALVVEVCIVAGLALTAVAGNAVSKGDQERRLLAFERQADSTVEMVTDRMEAAEATIRGMEGLFASGPVSRDSFHRYVAGSGALGNATALEFVRRVDRSQREAFQESVRADESAAEYGYPDMVVHPSTAYEDLYVVDYVVPVAGNEVAYGYDLGSNAARRSALEQARDTGATVATEGIRLVQDETSRVGVLLMRPVYDGSPPPSVIEDRQARLLGVVTGVFLVEDLVANAPIARTGGTIVIEDIGQTGVNQGGSVLYATTPQESPPDALSIVHEMTVGGRVWRATLIEGTPEREVIVIERLVWLTGILLTSAFALTATTILMSRNRAARAAQEATAELREQAVELRTARDDALAADRLKTTFLATMSHELRTPLNAVIGLSSVLSNEVFGPLTAKQAEYLERITTSGDHLLHLIDDVLSLARIEAGKEDLTLTPMDLAQEVSSAVDLLRAQAEANQITLRIDLPSEPIVVSADRRRLRQILLNLVSNAIKFTPTSREVGVDLRLAEGGAEIAVWDQGIGIPSEDLERIFEPFFQSDSGLSRSNEGTGLGLTLTRRLCEMHGARIRVESSDRGSRFAIEWPTVDQTVPEAPVTRDPKHRPPCLAGMRVLLAEDNEANRVLARDLLEYARCDVVEATDGRQALHLARQWKPDLVLLDMQLPELDGIGVLRALRSDPATAHIPVISVTAMVMDEDVERAMNTGCDGLLPKPYTQDEFFAAILSVAGDPIAV